ncbi:MCE family protein [Nocardioides humilatus]|uniref:MCE family protein n=1 Tax=Nocardioides humilatus TaxID=2607660 RepID=A0A5B1LKI7_9ACTN|nr:MCE family protein [Nocardioides humilatus]KAA1420976.1 MCE family protein [Nocardioides humilatus]
MAARLESIRLPLAGFCLLLVLAALAVAAVADYRGAFASTTEVTLYVPDAGNQLSVGAQVKLRGAVVGTVEKIEPSSRGARLTLALEPDQVHLVPKNTVARILPKTLVGQDYVDLVVPSTAAAEHVEAGDEIQRDTSATSATLEGALDHLLAVLRVLPPQKVASTLNAVSTALEGRGAELGATLTRLQRYLTGFNPSLPDLTADLEALARVSRTYSDAAPDLLAAVDDLSTTTVTIADQQAQLRSLFSSLSTAGDDLEDFLSANESHLIDLVDVSRSTLTTLATYAPEYPCLIEQLAGLVPRVDRIFGKGDERPALHITLQVTNSRGKYRPGEEPAYLDTRGPRCYEIVRYAPQYPTEGPIRDGSVAPPAPVRREGGTTIPTLPLSDPAGSPEEADLIGGLVDGDAGIASLLLGPLLRGSEVSAR